MTSYSIDKRLLTIQQRPLKERRFVIAHESGNPNNTGPKALENEIQYMKRNALNGGSYTSHWVGGGGKIIQLAKTGWMQFGAGAKANPYAFAQVELARTADPVQFKQDYDAYVWLLRKLAAEAGIPIRLNEGNSVTVKGIKTHHWISKHVGGTSHTDPDSYLAGFGISLTQFASDITQGLSSTQKDVPQYLTHAVQKGDSLWGIAKRYHSTVSWLKSVNQLPSEVIYIGQLLKITEKTIPLNAKETIQQIQRTVGTTPDGVYGEKTKKAILQLLQRTTGIYPDGIWKDSISHVVRTLKSGCNGWDVYAVQSILFCRDFINVGTIDKDYGSLTTAAVKEFQYQNQLVVDGKCGPKTLKKLFQ